MQPVEVVVSHQLYSWAAFGLLYEGNCQVHLSECQTANQQLLKQATRVLSLLRLSTAMVCSRDVLFQDIRSCDNKSFLETSRY